MTRSALREKHMNADDRTQGCAARSRPLAMEISFQDEERKAGEVRKATNLQNAFLEFRQKRQREMQQAKQMEQKAMESRCDPVQMSKLRQKFLEQAKTYFGVPYAKRYHEPGTAFHDSPLFLDCCGLVRQVLRDLKEDFGFTIGSWNQAYMFDLLPVVIDKEEDMKPGDLVFISGTYFNPKSKAQRHDMVHVEIWLGEGEKTIGARWQKGVVQIHDSYKFEAKSYYNMQYHFRSIDTWLTGVCKSFCEQHAWRKSRYMPGQKSVFTLLVEGEEYSVDRPEEGDELVQDQAASDEDEQDRMEDDALGDEWRTNQDEDRAAHQPAKEEDQKVVDNRATGGGGVASSDGDSLAHQEGNMQDADRMSEVESDESVSEADQLGLGGVRVLARGSDIGTKSYPEDDSSRKKDNDTLDIIDIEDFSLDGDEMVDSECMLNQQETAENRKNQPSQNEDVLLVKDNILNYEHKIAVCREGNVYDEGFEVNFTRSMCEGKTLNHEHRPANFGNDERECQRDTTAKEGENGGRSGDGVKTKNVAWGRRGKASASGEGSAACYRDHGSVGNEQTALEKDVSGVDGEVSPQSIVGTLDDPRAERFQAAVGEVSPCGETNPTGQRSDAEEATGLEPRTAELAVCEGPMAEAHAKYVQLSSRAWQAPAVVACPNGSQTAGGHPTQAASPAKPAAERQGRRASRTPADRRKDDDGRRRKDGSPRRNRARGLGLITTSHQPTFFLGGGNGNWMIEKTLYSLGWKRVDDKHDESFSLKWVECKSHINYNAFKEGLQLVNHISNIGLLTTKMGLLNSLQEHDRVMEKTSSKARLPLEEFFPETHRLSSSAEKAKFVHEIYKEGEVWICKPTGMNQGKGIYLISNKQELTEKLGMSGEPQQAPSRRQSISRPPQGRIIQRYIANPLLLNGCKFDVRAYMLIASTRPYVVLYHPGYVRLSCVPYTPYSSDSTQGLHAHLTNQYVQKKHPLYSSLKEDTVWSFEKLQEYVDQNLNELHNLPDDWVASTFEKRMQQIMLVCFESVRQKLHRRSGYFDLLGFDFMVDENFKVWLLEINVNPALHTNCQVLMERIPGVVNETLRLVLEIFEKTKKKRAVFPLQELKSFRLLYNGEAKR